MKDFEYPDEISKESPSPQQTINHELDEILFQSEEVKEVLKDDYPDSEIFQKVIEAKVIQNYSYKPSSTSIRRNKEWLENFLSNEGKRLNYIIRWEGASRLDSNDKKKFLYTKLWFPGIRSIGNNSFGGLEDPEGKELLFYMSTIEDIYKYRGYISNSSFEIQPSLKLEPVLNIPYNFYTVRDFHRLSQVKIGDGTKSLYYKRKAEENARTIFLVYLAHSFILEKHKLVDWSLLDYDDNSLYFLLSSTSFYLYEYNPITKEYSLNIDDTIVPTDPTIIFTWCKKKNLLNKSRARSRDYILNWCRRKIRHYQAKLKIEGLKNEKTRAKLMFDYYWNTMSIPTLTTLVKGNKIYHHKLKRLFISKLHSEAPLFPNKVFYGNNYNNLIAPFQSSGFMPDFIKRANPKQEYYIGHYAGGCQGRSWLINYLMKIINIPCGVDYTFFESGHASIVMPAEPDPKAPKMWILPHTDSLMRDMLKTAFTPVSSYFYEWESFIKELKNNKINTNSIIRPSGAKLDKAKNSPNSISTSITENQHVLIKIADKKTDQIEATGKIVAVITAALIRLRLISDKSLVGPYSGWIYTEKDVAGNKLAELVKKMIQAIASKGSGDSKQYYEAFLELKKKAESSESTKGAIAIWYYFDRMMLNIFSEW